LHQGSRPNCNPQVLIYAFFDLYNHKYVTFGKVISIFACIGGAILFIGGIILIITARFSTAKLKGFIDSIVKEFPDIETNITGSNWFLAFCFSFSGITLIVFSELVLKRNKMNLSDAPLTSTSQLLPLLVGIFTLVSTVWSVITDKEEEGTEETGEGMAMA
jgi:hypothetical protein